MSWRHFKGLCELIDFSACLVPIIDLVAVKRTFTHTQTHLMSHSKCGNKGKSPFFYRNERGSDWLIVLRNTRLSVLSGFPVLHHHHHLPCTLSPARWTTGIVGNTDRWRIKVMLLHKKLSWGGAADMNAQHWICRHHGCKLKRWHERDESSRLGRVSTLWMLMIWVHPMLRSHSLPDLISQSVLLWTACQTFFLFLPSLSFWSMLCKYMLYRR